MRRPRRRASAIFGTAALLGSVLAVLGPAPNASAGSVIETNACLSNATATYSDLNFTHAGTDSPDPATVGVDTVGITAATFHADVPADLLIAGYNLGLLVVGPNSIPSKVWVARQATGVATATDVQQFDIIGSTTITDPNGVPGTGDETATPIAVDLTLADWTGIAPSAAGTINWQQGGSIPEIPAGVVAAGAVTPAGSVYISAQVAGGLIKANFDCQPGLTDVDGPDNTVGTPDDETTFVPNAASPFETTTVTAPPTAPVALDDGPGVGSWGNATVGGSQSVTLDLTANDSDVNGDLDPSSTALGATSPSGGTVVFNGDGTATYTNTDPNVDADPVAAGQQDVFTYTVDDLDPVTAASNEATVTITVLANACTADPSCSLSQILTVPVAGDVMTMEQADKDVFMAGVGGFDPATGQPTCVAGPVTLNGEPQVACGLLNQITVVNARGTDAGWDLTGQVTDFSDGTIPGNVCPASDPNTWNNHCIPGNNMGWFPAAAVAHFQIPGDVASVSAGSALFPANALIPQSGPGLESDGALLCSSPSTESGGTFTCDAGLALGVPASAAAGIYIAVLTLTLA